MDSKLVTLPSASRNRVLTLAALGLLAVALAPGCDKAKQALAKGKSAASKVAGAKEKVSSAAKQANPETRALAAASEKMNAYADCLNGFGSNVRRSQGYYLRWADAKTGPTGKERHVYGLYKLNLDPETRCAQGVTKVRDAEPDMPELEKAADAFVEGIRAATPLINEAHAYYDQKDYKDDAFAKGKALHPKLMAAFDTFLTANDQLARLFDHEDDALAQRRLTHLANTEGKKMRYRHLLSMRLAKRLLRASDSTSPLDLKDLDGAALKTALDAYQAAFADAKAYAASHKKEFPTASSYSSVGRAGDAFVKAAKELSRRKREGAVFTGKEQWIRTGNAKMQDGHPAQVVDKYNDLIRDSNNLRL